MIITVIIIKIRLRDFGNLEYVEVMKLVIYCSTLLSESHKEWNVECDVSPDITQSHSIRNRFKESNHRVHGTSNIWQNRKKDLSTEHKSLKSQVHLVSLGPDLHLATISALHVF